MPLNTRSVRPNFGGPQFSPYQAQGGYSGGAPAAFAPQGQMDPNQINPMILEAMRRKMALEAMRRKMANQPDQSGQQPGADGPRGVADFGDLTPSGVAGGMVPPPGMTQEMMMEWLRRMGGVLNNGGSGGGVMPAIGGLLGHFGQGG